MEIVGMVDGLKAKARHGAGSRCWVDYISGMGRLDGGAVEAAKDEVEVVGDGGCESVHARNGAEAHGKGDERVLDEILPGVFKSETEEESVERRLRNGSVHSFGQRAPGSFFCHSLLTLTSDTQFESGYTVGLAVGIP
jgi:hypothetical protein